MASRLRAIDGAIFSRYSYAMNPKYLKSGVLGACDGIVTTFAVVAGVAGAGLPSSVIVVLGLSNMVADGLSMSVGDYLGERSEYQLIKQNTGKNAPRKLWKSGVVTFLAFNLAAVMPLFPYILSPLLGIEIPSDLQFPLSIVATMIALFVAGSLRSLILKTSWIRNGLEMLAVGSVAALAAYVLGSLVEKSLLN